MQERFQDVVGSIKPLDEALRAPGQARLDGRTKPVGSLGRLEELALKLYMIQGGEAPAADPARFFTIAGDHGVAAQGVSAFPQAVTRQMVANFLAGGAAINVLARQAGAELLVVDAGCAGGEFEEHPALVRAKVAEGTADLSLGPAMSREQCLQAVLLGVALADEAHESGVRVLGMGDMGIANTTPSTALFCAYLGLKPKDVTGPGTGLDAAGVTRKAEVVGRGLDANADAVASGDGLAVLAALGGLEIAALAGLVLGGAANRQAVLVDGFISTAAYLAAWRIQPLVADYCFLSHASAEPGHARAVAGMGLTPLLDLGMRLGEGTGAALALTLLRAGAAVFNDMAGFDDAGVDRA